MEKHTIYFSKTFRTGVLKGLTVPCEIGFPTQALADKFARKIRPTVGDNVRTDILTHDSYVITDVAYQRYAR